MSYVRDLLARLRFDTDTKPVEAFDDAIDNAKKKIEETGEKTGGLMARLSQLNQVWELGTKIATGAWDVLKGLTTDIAAQGAALADTSAQVGVNTTELQRLQYAAEMTGSSADTVNKALLEQSKIMREASMNSGAPFNLALKEIGLTLGDIESLDPATRFGVIGEALGGVADKGRQSALSLALFGGEGAKILPMTLEGTAGIKKLGDEAERMGFVLGGDVIDAGASFDDTLVTIGKQVHSVKNDIATALMPTIAKLAGEMSKWITANKSLIADNIKGFIEGLISAGKTLGPIIMTAASAVQSLVKSLGGADAVMGPVTAGLGALRIAAMAAVGPWGLIAVAAVGAGMAIAKWMDKATKSTEEANRAAMRLTETQQAEAQVGRMTTEQLIAKKAQLAADRARNKADLDTLAKTNTGILGQKTIQDMQRIVEKGKDLETIDSVAASVDKELTRRKDEAKSASDSKYAEAALARKVVDDAAAADKRMGMEKDELRALRRKKNKSQADKDRLKELEKSTGDTGGGGGGKAAAADKQAGADELVLAASGREGGGILGATQAPGAGTTVNNINITLSPTNHIGPITLPAYAAANADSFGRAAGAAAAVELDRQNAEAGAYFSTGRTGKRT